MTDLKPAVEDDPNLEGNPENKQKQEPQEPEKKPEDPNPVASPAKVKPITNADLTISSAQKQCCDCKKPKCCIQNPCFNNDCLQLYLGCQPATEQNNCGLAVVNCICCGCGLCMASCCESPLPRSSLVCAGIFQFLTVPLGVGILFSVMSGLAICFEDSCW